MLVFVAEITACTAKTRKEHNIFIGKLNEGGYLRGLSIKMRVMLQM
jgi:hypothetical protein